MWASSDSRQVVVFVTYCHTFKVYPHEHLLLDYNVQANYGT